MLLSFILFAFSAASLGFARDYHEQLNVQPLPNGLLLASFNFRGNTSVADFKSQNFRFFPRSLGQILQHTHTKELHLRFSTGEWNADSWGVRPWSGSKEGGTGVELWAWVDSPSKEEAHTHWLSLTNLLSGFFCASINFIDASKTISPAWSFDFDGSLPPTDMTRLHLLHGSLPHEVVCTENLTPFLKLLPCKGKAGIASLIDGHHLFDASWQTMSLDVRYLCPDDSDSDNCILQFEQTIDMVLNIERSKRPHVGPIPRPAQRDALECDTSKSYSSDDTCFPLKKIEDPAISLKEIFGAPIQGTCSPEPEFPLENQVCVTLPAERTAFVVYDDMTLPLEAENGNDRCFSLKDSSSCDVNLLAQVIFNPVALTPSPLLATRDVTGYGAQMGGVQAIFRNPSTVPISIVYLESLPWFMRPYLSTLKARVFQDSLMNSSSHPIHDLYFRQAKDRVRGTHLELSLDIPSESSVVVTYQFDKALLRYTEYPPDANRGFDVPPAVVRVLAHGRNREGQGYGNETEWTALGPTYVRTTSLLLPLPTPDFSMPYNVILFTSTIIALSFGGVFNLLTRRFVLVEAKSQSVLNILTLRLKEKMVRLKGLIRVGRKTSVKSE